MDKDKVMNSIEFQVQTKSTEIAEKYRDRFKKLARSAFLFFTLAILMILLCFGDVKAQAIIPFSNEPTSQTVFVPMPDGVKLAATIHLPGGRGPWPVLLIRTPYGRKAYDQGAVFFTSLGIALVVQDARGRFDSEGQYGVFFGERSDGQATLEWIVNQPWALPRVATRGASAKGIVQYLMAPGASEALVCQWVDVATPDLYADAVYQGGVYRTELANAILGIFRRFDLAQVWRSNYLSTSYWDPVRITNNYKDVSVAAVHVGGWFDIFARGTVNAFLGYRNQGRISPRGSAGKQHLIMGPWTHATYLTGLPAGELTFPNAASPDYIPWLYTWLKDCLLDGGLNWAIMDELTALPAVRYYTMGAVGEAEAPGNEWNTADTWPPAGSAETPLYLYPDNALSFNQPRSSDIEGDTFSYDPAKPVPTIGGNNLFIKRGAYDQRLIEQRDDVVVYSTEPLEEPIEVTGDVRAEIWITTDVPDTDLVVRLTDVYPDGRSMLIADGILRARYHDSPDFTAESFLRSGFPYSMSIDLGPTSIVFNKGHRIRISVTSSNSPRFSPNPNTGEVFLNGKGWVATTTILRDAAYPSAVILPVVGKE